MSERTGWDRGLAVAADDRGLIGQAGAVLLRKLVDRVGLTADLAEVLPVGSGAGWRDRAVAVVQLAVAIVLGAVNLSDAEQLQAHHQGLFGPAVSDSTTRRTLVAMDEEILAKIAKVRARVRWHVWSLLYLRRGGFPWLKIAGKRLQGWVVIDMDATIISAASKKQGAAATWKKTFGFHPLAAWCANTGECLAMLLCAGNAGSNTVADHLRVLREALVQVPGASTAKILVRVDGAGATHGLHEHLRDLNTMRRTVRFTTGWTITDEDRPPARESLGDLDQAGRQPVGGLLCGRVDRTELPGGLDQGDAADRPPDQAVRPADQGPHRVREKDRLEVLGHRYQHQQDDSDPRLPPSPVARRPAPHAVVEDRVRTNKAMGLHNLPSKSWQVNEAWMLSANFAADLDAWLRLLALHDQEDLADAEPDTMRFRLYHLLARLSRHARRRWLRIEHTWPWADAFTTAWRRLTDLPAVT